DPFLDVAPAVKPGAADLQYWKLAPHRDRSQRGVRDAELLREDLRSHEPSRRARLGGRLSGAVCCGASVTPADVVSFVQRHDQPCWSPDPKERCVAPMSNLCTSDI